MSTVIGREFQFQYLSKVLGKYTALPSSLLLWGPNATGKSLVAEKALEEAGIQYVAQVNAREIVCGLRQFLHSIVQQLFHQFGNPADLDKYRCDSTFDFVNSLRELGRTMEVQSNRFVVVVEEMETLRTESGEVIEVLSRLQDLLQFNICVLFLSTLPFSSYSCLLDLKPMASVYFPQYTQDELTHILNHCAPADCDTKLYNFYITMTVKIFYRACRDFRKLKRIALLNFEKFVSSAAEIAGSSSKLKMIDVWRLIQPKLTKDFQTMKSNIVPADHEDMLQTPFQSQNKNLCVLPKSVKYLLIAAYLAAFNPAKVDKRFFVKAQLGKKRRKVETTLVEKSQDPQVFSQSRLLAIYGFLTDYSDPKSPFLLGHLTQLCVLQLLERVDGTAAPLDEPKFRCLASFEFVDHICRSLDFDIRRHLYQFT